MPKMVELVVEDDGDVSLAIDGDSEISLTSENVVEVTTSDYTKLINKPTINASYPLVSAVLETNYDEVDPTVPDWAKDDEPQEVTETHVEFIWATIFNN